MLLPAALAGLALADSCSPRFPVLPPVPRQERIDLARMRAEEDFVRGREYDMRGLPQMAARLYE